MGGRSAEEPVVEVAEEGAVDVAPAIAPPLIANPRAIAAAVVTRIPRRDFCLRAGYGSGADQMITPCSSRSLMLCSSLSVGVNHEHEERA
jgi:hypothetical protein